MSSKETGRIVANVSLPKMGCEAGGGKHYAIRRTLETDQLVDDVGGNFTLFMN